MTYNPVKKGYRQSSAASISVGLTDFLTNRGYLTLLGGKTADRYLASSIAFYSNQPDIVTEPGDNTANDIDFDALANTPLIMDGRGFVTVPLVHWNGTGGADDVATTLTVTLRKWDGTTETDIISENATATIGVGATTSTGQVWTVDFDIPTTSFKATDTIRITVETTAPGVSKEIWVVHDPLDRNTGANNEPDTSKLTALLPIKLDL